MHLLWPEGPASVIATEPAPAITTEDFEPFIDFIGATFLLIVLLLRLLFAKFHFVQQVLLVFLGILHHRLE